VWLTGRSLHTDVPGDGFRPILCWGRIGSRKVARSAVLGTRILVRLLVAGDKSGVSNKNFYKRLIAKADERSEAHLSRLKKKERK
jgi:hypothetical protein